LVPFRLVRLSRPRVSALAAVLVTILTAIVGLQLTIGGQAKQADCPEEWLTIVSSTEKSTSLDNLAESYNKENHVLQVTAASSPVASAGGGPDGSASTVVSMSGGRFCARVRVFPLTSGAAEQALAKGWESEDAQKSTKNMPKPDVWTPTTSLWVELLNESLARAKKPALVQRAYPAGDPYPVLARSPVIVAMPQEKADRLRRGLTEMRMTFDWDVLQLSTNASGLPQAWGAPDTPLRYGEPGWGRFWFRKDNATTSTSGLAATIATYKAANAASGGEPPTQQADLPLRAFNDKKLVEFVRRVEAGIEPDSGYSLDATEMMKDLAKEDLTNPLGGWSKTSAVVVQEQYVFQYNANQLPFRDSEQKPGRTPKQPLVPFYPASGTLVMDHPYVKLLGLSAERTLIADNFLSWLRSGHAGFTKLGFRDEHGLFATDEKTRSYFGKDAEEAPRTIPYPTGAGIMLIQDSWQRLRKKASVWILIDDSRTMNLIRPDGHTRLKAAQDAAVAAVEKFLNAGDKVELRMFPGTSSPVGAVSYRSVYQFADVGDKTRLLDAIRSEQTAPGPVTPLYANILAAYRDARAYADRLGPTRKAEEIVAIVVLTDGTKDTDAATPRSIVASIEGEIGDNKSVRIYSIAFGPDQDSIKDLQRISKLFDATDHGDTTITDAFAQALSVV
jgi:Ca-activated chloride channel homolog